MEIRRSKLVTLLDEALVKRSFQMQNTKSMNTYPPLDVVCVA